MALTRSTAVFGLLVIIVIFAATISTVSVSGNHIGNTYNCTDFPNQAAAQAHYRQHPTDQDGLDADDDGIACETLPCPCDMVPVGSEPTPNPSPSPTPDPSPSPTPPSGTGIKGDADCNGQVQIPDSIYDQQQVAGLNPGLCVESLGNVDCDGSVTIFDAIDIQLYIAGLPVPLPQGCSPIGSQASTSTLAIHHIDVEQGDATLIVVPG